VNRGWGIVKFGDVCTVDRTHNKGAALPYVGLEDILSGEGRFTGNTEPKKVQSSTFRFTAEHILYGRLRPYLNKVYLPDFNGHCSTEIFPIRPAPNADRRYLYYWLSMDSTVKQIDRTSTGARMPRANVAAILEFSIPLPSLPEQQRIVAILDEAFAGLATVTANAEKNLKNARELFDSYLNSVFTRKGKGWITCRLGSEVKFIDYRGKTPPKMETGIRLITAKNVKMNRIQRDPEEFIDANVYDGWMTRGYPRKGDVLFTTEAPLGNVAQLDTDETVVIGQRLITMQPNEKVLDRTFLKYALMSRPAQTEIFKRGTGATVVGIKASLLRQVPICFPVAVTDQETLANAIGAIADAVSQLEDNYRNKLKELQSLGQALLQQAFSGGLTAEAPALVPLIAKSTTDTKRDTAMVLALAYQRHKDRNRDKSLGHTKEQKILHMVEAAAEFDLGRQPIRDAAGPNDFDHMETAEKWAEDNQYFRVSQQGTGIYQFRPLTKFSELLKAARSIEPALRTKIERIIDLFIPMDAEQAEVFASAYAAWNNLLIEGRTATDDDIIEACYAWHPRKSKIPRAKFIEAIQQLKKANVRPTGRARFVPPPAQGRLPL
jgi:type I restriction enzyme S subunit